MHHHRLNSSTFTQEIHGVKHVSQQLSSENVQADSMWTFLESTGALKEPIMNTLDESRNLRLFEDLLAEMSPFANLTGSYGFIGGHSLQVLSQ